MSDAGDAGDELLCPLCGYDLRGLPPGRCPECGHAFDPDALRRAEAARHPYLIEHHPKRPIRATLRTLLAALRPGRFWRVLTPAHAIRFKPLAAFAAVVHTAGGHNQSGSPTTPVPVARKSASDATSRVP